MMTGWSTIELTMTTTASNARIAYLTLNRLEARNALDGTMARQILEACKMLAGDSTLSLVVLRAAGPVFCAGADLKERAAIDDNGRVARRLQNFSVYDSLERLPMPLICVVQGACVGSGCELAMACDFIIASDQASFRVPEAHLGSVGATQRLPRAVGRRMAKQFMFTGREFPSSAAREIGLVNQVVPHERLDAAVDELVSQISSAPVEALRLAKRCIDRGTDDSRYGALAHEILAIEEQLNSAV